MKLVREHINFQRGLNPKEAMGIGARKQIIKWFDDLNISPDRYTIDDKLNINIMWLDLHSYSNSSSITSLPNSSSITSLPDNLTVTKWLDLRGTSITNLPNNLTVGENLYLQGTAITSLPDDLKVEGIIFKDF